MDVKSNPSESRNRAVGMLFAGIKKKVKESCQECWGINPNHKWVVAQAQER